jgi:hypothetical protein
MNEGKRQHLPIELQPVLKLSLPLSGTNLTFVAAIDGARPGLDARRREPPDV